MSNPEVPSFAPAKRSQLRSQGGEGVVSLRAGSVRVRHQQAGALDLSYVGDQPVLLYLFNGPRERRAWRSEPCRPGSFAVLTPGSPIEIDEPGPMELLIIAYEPDAAGALDRSSAECLADDGVRVLAQEIRRVVLNEEPGDTAYVEGLARTMLLRAYQVAGREPPPRSHARLAPATLRRVLGFIDTHLTEHMEVADLAAVAGLSRPYFIRAFEDATGSTPHRFVMAQRLALVREQLTDGDEPLATLAVRAGFSSHAHMTTAFRRAYGVTPAAYRAAEQGLSPRRSSRLSGWPATRRPAPPALRP